MGVARVRRAGLNSFRVWLQRMVETSAAAAATVAAPQKVPGRTDTFGDPNAGLVPWMTPLSKMAGLVDRKIILLATATITEDNIYMNGLFQNVVVLYRMFEAMGYAPIFLINEKPKSLTKIPGPLRSCRMIITEDMLRRPMSNVVALLEIGMSLDPIVRQFVKMIGGKLLKLYLGNILNIDIETPIFVNQHHFAHHVVGRTDMILVSPHYGQHAEYATYLNHVIPKDPKALERLIAPYVWDPNIFTRDGTLQLRWQRPVSSEDEVFVIMEPNISFQKCSLVPLLILERWYRDTGKASGWKGRVKVVNGERLDHVPHFVENVKPYLEIVQDGHVDLLDRRDIVSALREWPTATFVLHNYNNEYNYMTLELMWSGFPVLHNSPSWGAYGYSYEEADLAGAASVLETIRRGHSDRLEAYRGHAHTLAWRHSPYNPTIQAAWETVLKEEGRV